MLLLLLVFMLSFAEARTVRVFFFLEIQTNPDASELSIKTGPLLDWEYLGCSPHNIVLFKDFNTRDFVKERPWYGRETKFYSERYGYNYAYASADELFDKLVRDFGDKTIQDLGMVTTGWIKAECEGFEESVRAISLNGNISNFSFNQSNANENANILSIPLKECDDYAGHRYSWDTTIMITSDPANSSVYCNEEYIGQTPCRLTVRWKSERDRNEIRFEKSGYLTSRRIITPREERIHVVLQPMY